MSHDVSEPLVVDESDVPAVPGVPDGCEELALGNRGRNQADVDHLAAQLAALAGVERIKRLVIEPDSSLLDVRVVSAFPSLEQLRVHGTKIRTLDGMSAFGGHMLHIDTGKSRARDIGRIGDAQIRHLSLRHSNQGDLEAVARCRHLSELQLANCPALELERWRQVPIEDMQLWGGVIQALRDASSLQELRKLMVHDCRNLQAFEGDNGNVTWMIIQVCNRLDYFTIGSFSNLAHLTIRGAKDAVPLSIVEGLGELRTLSLLGCRVVLDRTDLTRAAPMLEEIVAERLTKEEVSALGAANPALSVSSATWSYSAGALARRGSLARS